MQIYLRIRCGLTIAPRVLDFGFRREKFTTGKSFDLLQISFVLSNKRVYSLTMQLRDALALTAWQPGYDHCDLEFTLERHDIDYITLRDSTSSFSGQEKSS